MVESGFLVSGEGFVWARQGLTKIKEIQPGDQLLGLESGQPSWSTIRFAGKRPGVESLLRITTDGNEIIVSKFSEVFSVGGIRKVSSLSLAEILETYNIPQEIVELMNDGKPIFTESEVGPLRVDSKIAYILGTQVKSEKLEDKVIIKDLNPNHAYEVAKLCSEALREQFIQHNIYYVEGGRKVRIDCAPLAQACSEITVNNIPKFIRQSNTTVLRYFLVGILDTILCLNEGEDPPTFFTTLARQSEFRRFLTDCMRLFGVIPTKACVVRSSQEPMFVKTYVNPKDLADLGLRFIKVRDEPLLATSHRIETMSYCTVRNIAELQGKLCQIPVPKLHWSLIVDMAPLHHHALPEF